jgi:uncharacterized Zn-finger protein
MELSANTIQSFRLFSIPTRVPSLPVSLLQNFSELPEGVQRNTCRICGAEFSSHEDLQAHLLSDLLHSNGDNEEGFRSNSLSTNAESIDVALITSRDIAGNKGSGRGQKESEIKCIMCQKTFSSYKGMKQHMGKKHKLKVKQSKCDQCQKEFVDKHALKLHVRQVHEQSTRAICPNCNKVFYNKYTMAKHMEKKHG